MSICEFAHGVEFLNSRTPRCGALNSDFSVIKVMGGK